MKINVLCGENRGAHGGDPLRSSGGAARPQGRAVCGAKRRRPDPGALPHAPPIAPKWWPPEVGAIRGAILCPAKGRLPRKGECTERGQGVDQLRGLPHLAGVFLGWWAGRG